MLYDSGATHSFISHDCVDRLGLSMSELPYMLVVSTPARKPVKTCQCCLNCHFQIDGRSFIADLICLPLFGFDLMLGIHWLSANYAIINRSDLLCFPLCLLSLLPVYLFLNSIKVGSYATDNQGYTLLMASDVELEQVLDEIS